MTCTIYSLPVSRRTPVYPGKQTSSESVGTSDLCQNRTHALRQEKAVRLLRRRGRAMAAMTRLATVDQLLRKALAVLDASGTADGFNNLGGRNIMDKIS